MNSIGFTDPADLGTLLRNREHWFFVFGPSHLELIDELDRLLDHEPTYPTVITPVTMTIVPKLELPKHRVDEIMYALTGLDISGHHGSQDIFPVIDEKGEEAGPIFRILHDLVSAGTQRDTGGRAP